MREMIPEGLLPLRPKSTNPETTFVLQMGRAARGDLGESLDLLWGGSGLLWLALPHCKLKNA